MDVVTAFFVAWVIGAIAFVAWRFRVEMRTTHRPAPKHLGQRAPLDLDEMDRQAHGYHHH